jgi:tryptophan synthase alpha subunit
MTPLEMDKKTEMIGPAAKGEEWVRPPLVPVLAANIPDTRLDQLIAAGYDFFYLMSDFKITGSTFSLHPRLREIAGRIKSGNSAARIGIGFGINTPEQIKAVLEVADYAIIGSALIVAQQEGRLENYLENIAHSTTPAV